MARRLYLGRLPPDARADDVGTFFDGYGRIVDCRVMTGFGFVEFETSKDAEDAVHQFNGKPFMGTNIIVEFAKENRPRREPFENDRPHGARSRRPTGIRLVVSGISRDTSWQDLKDFGREVGSVSFADINRDLPGQGVLEYLSREDADRAVKELDGKDLRGRPVQVAHDDSRSGADNYRRENRFGDDYQGRRQQPYRGRPASPRRSRSPLSRGDYDGGKPAGYDDYRRGGRYDGDRRHPDDRRHSDRRHPDDHSDRNNDDHRGRRDEGSSSRRGDKDGRYDERATRNTNGDGGWAR